ncbi:MAG: glycoside hydrolase family 76 protein, partial [Fermentimonas sp.]|nr:glycoside hydrolase family 76 protein [Fermentimonas sp.]
MVVTAFSSELKGHTTYKDKAVEMFQLAWELYRVPEYGLFAEYYPSKHKPNLTYFNDSYRQPQEVSYLWPMSGIFSSAVLMGSMDPEKYGVYIDSMVLAMEEYYDTSRVPFGYQAYPVRFEKVDRYYDDNGLVGIDYVDSYMVTEDPRYLEKAKQVMTFILSGWDDRFEGAVPWLEGVDDQKPACSNGKTLVLALKLFEATGDRYYLDLGIRFYDWMDKYLKDPERGVVWNSLSTVTAEVVPDLYTYNTGTLLQAAVALYRFTGDNDYLNDAEFLAEGSYNVFFKFTDEGIPYISDLPWFNLVLFRGYHDLYDVTKNSKYVDTMIKGLDYENPAMTRPSRSLSVVSESILTRISPPPRFAYINST